MATTKIQICPPPPPPPSPQITTNSTAPAGTVTQVTATSNSQAASQLQGFGSQPWQGWFSQVYNQIKTQFVVTTAVADGAATDANTALANAATALAQANVAIADAAAAQAAVAGKLNKSASDTLTGAVNVTTSGGFVAGTLTWDASGNRTGGYGVAMTSKGIVGYSSSLGGYSFSLDNSGNANFAGTLSAANGTFTGTLIGSNGTFTGTLSSVNGTFTGSLVSVNGTFTGALVAATGSFAGSLSAASGTFTGTVSAGTINGGTVTGANIRTSASGQRVEIDTSGIKVYNSGGSVIGTLDAGGLFFSKPAGASASAVSGQSASSIGAGVDGSCSSTAPGGNFSNSGSGPALQVSSSGNAINIQSGVNGIVQNGGGANFLRYVLPIVDNTYSLGGDTAHIGTNLRWTAVYAMSSTITTSDGRTKNRITPLTTEIGLVDALSPVSYYQNVSRYEPIDSQLVDDFGDLVPATRYNRIEGKRPHFGFDAREVRQAMTAVGIKDAGLWCLENPDDPNSTQSLRYEEFIAVLWGKVRELSARVNALEASGGAAAGGV